MSSIIKMVDGVPVYMEDKDSYSGIAYFNHWLYANDYKEQDVIRAEMLCDDYSEEDVDEEINNLFEEFSEWCELQATEDFYIIPEEI